MAKFGYVRVSTKDQNVDLQKNALLKYGVSKKNIVEEVISGYVAPNNRPVLTCLLKKLQRHDELVVWKLDRLGRSAFDMLRLDDILKELDVKLISLTEGLDTTTPIGQFYYTILASLAQMERDTIRERVIAGLNAARSKGRTLGRPRKLCPEIIRQIQILREGGETVAEIMRGLNLGRATIYRALNVELPEEQETDVT